MSRHVPTLGPVQETALIPLLGRAEETRRGRGLVSDPRALEIVASLDYDFDKWRGGPSLVGTVLRTRMMDEDVRCFLRMHPGGTVVELGCGLNTRFERVDDGNVQWLDVDLPDMIALRRRWFEDTPRRRMIATDLRETGWLDAVAASPGPVCFVSEAVLIYLDADVARGVIEAIARRFPGAWLVMDTTGADMVRSQARHDAMRHLPRESWFRWACDDPRELESWGIGLVLDRSRTFLDAGPEVRRRFPLAMRWAVALAPWFLRRRVGAYRLNRYVVADPVPDQCSIPAPAATAS